MNRGAPASDHAPTAPSRYWATLRRRGWALQKRGGVTGGPLAEGSRRRSDDVGHGGGHERRLAERRFPCGQQHVHERGWPNTRRLAPEIFWRQLLEMDPALDGIADDPYLLGLTQ